MELSIEFDLKDVKDHLIEKAKKHGIKLPIDNNKIFIKYSETSLSYSGANAFIGGMGLKGFKLYWFE